jgi:hypothetical protein
MNRNYRLALAAGSVLALGGAANAQGYFSFDDIPGIDAEPSVEIDLNPAMMGFFGEAARGAAGDASSALEGITNVRVRVYEGIGDDAQALAKFADNAAQTLERQGWQAVVRIREDGENVRIYMKPAAAGSVNAGTIEGLTVMITDSGDGDEAVFINVAGKIEPAQLGRLASQIGMHGMFDMVPGQRNDND